MPLNLAQKLIQAHLVEGEPFPGREIAIRIDQTLLQDATGTMAMLEFEALGVPQVKTELSGIYVDHNLLQTDFRNADDHVFLRTTAARFGCWYSSPGNGVSHQVSLERFAIPGKSLLGADSHTPSAGGLGSLAIGTGGMEVALAMAGKPFYLKMPKVMGVKLIGTLPPWVSAKDIILEMLRRYTVKGGLGRIIEYYGPGLANLTVADRAVITNMGAELGATTSLFPSDEMTRLWLVSQGREKDWAPLAADADATYDEDYEIDLSTLEPLIALPSSPDSVVPVREIAGLAVNQVIVGSSANPGYRDLMTVAHIVDGKRVAPGVSFEINPGSRQVLTNVIEQGGGMSLMLAGARIHQAGCLGCIGMGQAPGTNWVSLRTFPRNFPGRSGTTGDRVYLCSPETAAAAALTGVVTDPRTLGTYRPGTPLAKEALDLELLIAPPKDGSTVAIVRGPNIQPLPLYTPLPTKVRGRVLLKMGNNISTDEIMPAGNEVLPYRSNIPAISNFVLTRIDPTFPARAKHAGSGVLVGGENYGQGSSREHAAIGPRYLGVIVVISKSFARIHMANLANFGIVPLIFMDLADYDLLARDAMLEFPKIATELATGSIVTVRDRSAKRTFIVRHELTSRQVEMIIAGGLINEVRGA